MSRRRLLGLAASAAAMPQLGPLPSVRAHAATRRDLRFRALWRGSSIGEHRVAFGTDGDRLVVDTHVDIAVRVLFFNVFRLTHDAQEIWQSGRLVSVTSTTDRDGTRLQVSGNAVADGLRNIGVLNERDHRKITVLDGRTALVGGHCIVDSSWIPRMR